MADVFEPDAKGNIMKGRVVDIGSKDSLMIGKRQACRDHRAQGYDYRGYPGRHARLP